MRRSVSAACFILWMRSLGTPRILITPLCSVLSLLAIGAYGTNMVPGTQAPIDTLIHHMIHTCIIQKGGDHMKYVRINISLPARLKARLDEKRKEGSTASGYIRALLERELGSGKSQKQSG